MRASQVATTRGASPRWKALARQNYNAASPSSMTRRVDWLHANAPTVPLVVMGKPMMFWEGARAFNPELDKFLDSVGLAIRLRLSLTARGTTRKSYVGETVTA